MSRWIRDRDEYERGSKWFADWHRAQDDASAAMIDIDGLGCCHICYHPLYIVEATKAKARKCARGAESLAQLAGVEMFVFYRDEQSHPQEFLVDWRSARTNLGWIPQERAWLVLRSIRSAHRCPTNQKAV